MTGSLFKQVNAPGSWVGRKRVTVDVSDDSLRAAREATTLDRVHAAMLLAVSR